MTKSRKGYIAWVLTEAERARLLGLFPPAYGRVVAHHVTYKFGADENDKLPHETEGLVLGWADDGNGVQCLIIEISKTTKRADGSTYHITWSLGEGRKPVESNEVAKQWPFIKDGPLQCILHDPIPIKIEPKFIPF